MHSQWGKLPKNGAHRKYRYYCLWMCWIAIVLGPTGDGKKKECGIHETSESWIQPKSQTCVNAHESIYSTNYLRMPARNMTTASALSIIQMVHLFAMPNSRLVHVRHTLFLDIHRPFFHHKDKQTPKLHTVEGQGGTRRRKQWYISTKYLVR
jgi:hypothetical protein